MNDPKDILGVDPSGAVQSESDHRDFLWTDVAHGSAPFDWLKGYDGEKDLELVLSLPEFRVPIKNQGMSGSCGGQAESYGGASIAALRNKSYEEKSAKFTYSPVAVRPGGGSSGRDLSSRSINVGWGSEALTPSYESGQPPSEEFMERSQDITPAATEHAKKSRASSYVLLPVDIDEIAKAIRDYKFVRLGIVGSNNGTWLTEFPTSNTPDGTPFWAHWTAGLKAKMINGKKCIGFPNSWGENVGNNGWQWLTEEWFKPSEYRIFEPRCYVWNTEPIPPSLHHVFNKDLWYGLVDPENQILQTALRIDGEFPNVPYNDRFGEQTLAAVKKFQVKYGIVAPNGIGYGRCGPKTRAKLNQLFGS